MVAAQPIPQLWKQLVQKIMEEKQSKLDALGNPLSTGHTGVNEPGNESGKAGIA